MSAALEKSLDDIIASSRKAKKATNKKKVVGRSVTAKTSGKIAGKTGGRTQKKGAIVAKTTKSAKVPKKTVAPTMDLKQATKVVAHGLPVDLKLDTIRVC